MFNSMSFGVIVKKTSRVAGFFKSYLIFRENGHFAYGFGLNSPAKRHLHKGLFLCAMLR